MHPTILTHFKHADSIIYELAQLYGTDIAPLEKIHPEFYVRELCESIVSQQLSVKAARTIWLRSCEVVNWENIEHILSVPADALRTCGLSYQKVSYVKNIAQAAHDRTVNFELFDSMSDEEIITELTKIKGVGRWTAEMVLIFTLCRDDIFSAGDLGLRNAIDRLYGTQRIDPSDAQLLAEKWSPYRSYASRLLWKSLDNSA